MSSSNSSDMVDQISMVFSCVMDEAMSIVQAEEVATAATSSSTRWPKRRRCYINHDREATHFRLRHDYFDDYCMYLPSYFRRRYCMRMTLFLSIMHKLSKTSPYFSEGYDVTSSVGLTAL
jgi:hypothetical protein